MSKNCLHFELFVAFVQLDLDYTYPSVLFVSNYLINSLQKITFIKESFLNKKVTCKNSLYKILALVHILLEHWDKCF